MEDLTYYSSTMPMKSKRCVNILSVWSRRVKFKMMANKLSRPTVRYRKKTKLSLIYLEVFRLLKSSAI